MTLQRLEAVLDASGVAEFIEARLPRGVRPRQLRVRTLLLGLGLSQLDGRPAHLTRVHHALVIVDNTHRRRLGIEVEWRSGWHLVTYRQVERTFSLVVAALKKEHPDGAPSTALSFVLDALLEASVPVEVKELSASLAVDWSDHESFSCPAPKDGHCADDEASWGRRKSHQPGMSDELFFGYELQAATMVREERGPAVPELVRRMLLTSCHLDPPKEFVPVLQRMVDSGVTLGDVLADSGYAHRVPEHWALPLRQLGAGIVTDLHPHDRGPKGTHRGAILANGRLYCPATPEALLALGPLARAATREEILAHDVKSAELAHYQLTRLTREDADGYHRVACPATTGQVRCPLREASMTLSFERPEVRPPVLAPACCTQRTISVPVIVNAKTAQKHAYPSQAHRHSYARRTAVERTFSTLKDPASNDVTWGWCRMMGLTAVSLCLATTFVVRNQRVLDAFNTRAAEDARQRAAGPPIRTRRRRRIPLDALIIPNAERKAS
jgi:hypothetical protein